MITNRVQFIEYEGKKILLVDAANATEEKLLEVLEDVDSAFSDNKAKAPFLFLGDYTNIHYSIGLAEKFKSSLKTHRTFIKKYAAVGVPAAAQFLATMIAREVPYELQFFATQQEALEWLVK